MALVINEEQNMLKSSAKELLDLKDVDERLINENLKNYLERSRKL